MTGFITIVVAVKSSHLPVPEWYCSGFLQLHNILSCRLATGHCMGIGNFRGFCWTCQVGRSNIMLGSPPAFLPIIHTAYCRLSLRRGCKTSCTVPLMKCPNACFRKSICNSLREDEDCRLAGKQAEGNCRDTEVSLLVRQESLRSLWAWSVFLWKRDITNMHI